MCVRVYSSTCKGNSCILTYSSKGQGADSEVHQAVIGQQSSTGRLSYHPFDQLFIRQEEPGQDDETNHCGCNPMTNNVVDLRSCFYLVVVGEDVDDQRFLPLINKLDGFVDTAHCDDGQQRPEDLLLHHFGFPRHIFQHSGACKETGRRGSH